MRFVIFGAGAVGSTVGAHLSKAGAAVLLIGDPPHIEKIQTDGLKMSGKYGEFVTMPVACSALDDWQFQSDDVFSCVSKPMTPRWPLSNYAPKFRPILPFSVSKYYDQ